jgi:two-component system cell cycle response regulator
MKILIADDDSVSRLILERTLKGWGYETVVAENGIKALEILEQKNPPAIAILDWIMPFMEGTEVCRRIRMQSALPYTYILMLTAKREQQDLLQGMDSGADDFIRKPFSSAQLKARLKAATRIVELQNALMEKARTDPLTGLLNHGAILEEFNKEFHRCNRERKPLSVLIVDLDHFKKVNDTYGHQIGDTILQAIAEKLRTAFRCYDVVGRYGGEEFVVLLPGCGREDAFQLSDRVRQTISDAQLANSVSVTVSIGVACTTALQNPSTAEVFRAADQALYSAKAKGRNQVVAHFADINS